MFCTIYLIKNKKNGKQYIGFTSCSIDKRIAEHRSNAKRGSMYNLHQAIRKHGWEAFEVQEIYMSKDENHTKNIMEPYFIKEYQTYGKGYNMTPGGDGGPCTPEKAANISKSKKGKPLLHSKGNQYSRNQYWYTNGTINIKVHKDKIPPEGYWRGRVFLSPFAPYKRNKPAHNKGKRWVGGSWIIA